MDKEKTLMSMLSGMDSGQLIGIACFVDARPICKNGCYKTSKGKQHFAIDYERFEGTNLVEYTLCYFLAMDRLDIENSRYKR